MTERLHPRLAYRCKDDEDQNCRTSCSKYMRGECDGRSGMFDAAGGWMRNEILTRKRRKERSEIRISIDPGDLPGNVKFVASKLEHKDEEQD